MASAEVATKFFEIPADDAFEDAEAADEIDASPRPLARRSSSS
jgi:hypothetical protein